MFAHALLCSWLICPCIGFQPFITKDLWRIKAESTSLALHAVTTQSNLGDVNFIRELGGYERLLSRITPNTKKVSLSHGTAFIFDGQVTHDSLLKAVAYCMDRHPMLRAYISKDPELKKEYWSNCDLPTSELASQIVTTTTVADEDFDSKWQYELEHSLNIAEFPVKGPLWWLKNIVSDSPTKRSAWTFCFNHGSDDQQSANIVVADLLNHIYSAGDLKERKSLRFPKCVEDAIAPEIPSINTMKWSLFQLGNQVVSADMLPAQIMKNYRADPEKYTEEYANPDSRRTFLEYLTLTKEETAALRIICRANKVTITNALSAAILSLTSSFFQNGDDNAELRTKNLRFLLSVGLRPFGVNDPSDPIPSMLVTGSMEGDSGKGGKISNRKMIDAKSDWTGGTVACASGAVDFVVSVPKSTTSRARKLSETNGKEPIGGNKGDKATSEFWRLAQDCRDKAKDIIENNNYVPESVRLFGFGMKYADILTIVDAEAKNPGTMGRGYSCGVSNVGLVNLPTPSTASSASVAGVAGGDVDFKVKSGYYGTSHARNGVFCLLSSITIGDTLCGCLQFTSPFISMDEADRFKQGLVLMLRSLV